MVAADIAVPLPFSIPVTVVDNVIAGVVPALATVPANPLADTTETVDTVPVVGVVQIGASVVPDDVRTCPALPLPNIKVVFNADWYGIEPPRPPARLVAVVAVDALPVVF